jgi:hypothetical protein
MVMEGCCKMEYPVTTYYPCDVEHINNVLVFEMTIII